MTDEITAALKEGAAMGITLAVFCTIILIGIGLFALPGYIVGVLGWNSVLALPVVFVLGLSISFGWLVFCIALLTNGREQVTVAEG